MAENFIRYKMSSIMHLMVENYNELLLKRKDPLVDSWLLMNSPLPLLCILASYLYFVLHLGPKYMEKRKPYNLKYVLILYNGYQVVFSTWLCYQVLNLENLVSNVFLNSCSRNITYNRTFRDNSSRLTWWYFISKVIELLDTVFFVLRKKQNQVSFLHVYHHCVTSFFSWTYLKILPGEQGVVVGFVNSLVHVFMYTYYLLAALGPKYQKYLWWKKYITKIQLAQFCLILVYLVVTTALDCNVSKALTYFFLANTIIFLYLFSDFYRKAYKKNKEEQEISAKKLT